MRVDMLSSEAAARWEAYLAAECTGVRGERNSTLSAFISAAKKEPGDHIAAFARAWCGANLDVEFLSAHKHGAPMRLPLLCEIVGPVLLHGRSLGTTHHARWLAQLWNLLIRDPDWCARLDGISGPTALLEEALARDPEDFRARRLLVGSLIYGVEYNLHELPALLATEEELRFDLDRLRRLGPEGYNAEGYAAFLTAARNVVDGDRSERAIDAYFNSLSELEPVK